jgi:hypothetical protein
MDYLTYSDQQQPAPTASPSGKRPAPTKAKRRVYRRCVDCATVLGEWTEQGDAGVKRGMQWYCRPCDARNAQLAAAFNGYRNGRMPKQYKPDRTPLDHHAQAPHWLRQLRTGVAFQAPEPEPDYWPTAGQVREAQADKRIAKVVLP